MRRHTQREVLMKNTDQLRTKWAIGTHGPWHDSKEPSLGERNDGAKELLGFPLREGDHRTSDDGNTHLISESLGNLFFADESHAPSSSGVLSQQILRFLHPTIQSQLAGTLATFSGVRANQTLP